MKLSVSLPEEDVAFIDAFMASSRDESRSAVVQRAIAMLRAAELTDQYELAFRAWHGSGDAKAWDAAAGDGIGPG